MKENLSTVEIVLNKVINNFRIADIFKFYRGY